MGWLQSLFSPFKKLFLRLNSHRNKRSRGIYILYEDVKSCQYEDVHVLWSILVESHKSPALPNLPFTQSKLLCLPPEQVNERG
ncbi:hypothetical protein KSS87_015390 [Heliosperma pusillum]|nr:hypothetical protein KSS87_015390 [Heliosperma pusillum]